MYLIPGDEESFPFNRRTVLDDFSKRKTLTRALISCWCYCQMPRQVDLVCTSLRKGKNPTWTFPPSSRRIISGLFCFRSGSASIFVAPVFTMRFLCLCTALGPRITQILACPPYLINLPLNFCRALLQCYMYIGKICVKSLSFSAYSACLLFVVILLISYGYLCDFYFLLLLIFLVLICVPSLSFSTSGLLNYSV